MVSVPFVYSSALSLWVEACMLMSVCMTLIEVAYVHTLKCVCVCICICERGCIFIISYESLLSVHMDDSETRAGEGTVARYEEE